MKNKINEICDTIIHIFGVAILCYLSLYLFDIHVPDKIIVSICMLVTGLVALFKEKQ